MLKRITINLLLGATIATASLMNPANAQPDLERAALQIVADRVGMSYAEGKEGQPSLFIANAATANYPESGQSVRMFKIMDERTQQIHGVTLDQSGREVDLQAIEANEQAAYLSRYGKLEPALFERLARASAAESLEVVLWLKSPNLPAPQLSAPQPPQSRIIVAVNPWWQVSTKDVLGSQAENTPARAEAFLRQLAQEQAAVVSPVVDAVAERLSRLGYRPEKLEQPAIPALFARLPPAAIGQAAGWSEIEKIYLSPLNQPELNTARRTILANGVHARGITGAGVKVAQIEVEGRVATANPFLAGVLQDPSFVCSTPSAHSTGVAGIIRSHNNTYRGIAPNAILWAGGSCSGSTNELLTRSWAASEQWGAQVFNLSWGSNTNLSLGATDHFYDHLVFFQRRTVVKSAGNRGLLEGNVTSPGLAYNIITVGAFDDYDTDTWGDDVMANYSSWRNPISARGDREKPEVVAPGSYIEATTTASPWIGSIGSGTSYAAPMVAGTAALLLQRRPDLTLWPEAIKAIIMATALRNLEGSARLSDRDGVGGIIASRADEIIRGINGGWAAAPYSCTSTPASLDVVIVNLQAGRRTRVVLVWSNHPNYSGYTSRPSADLDLLVIGPGGSPVAASTSYDNTYEVIDFTPTTSGTYRVRVNRYDCPGASTGTGPNGIAWALWHR